MRQFLTGIVVLMLGVSGAAQLPLRGLFSGGPGETLGAAIAGIGDLDGDGHPEILVGAPRWSGAGADAGRVLVLSGADLSLIRTQSGQAGDKLGFALSALDDIDFDLVPDYALGLPGADRVQIHSGQTGALIRVEAGPAGEGRGRVVAGLPDIDGDGAGEILIGLPQATVMAPGDGRALLISGATGAVLLDLHGDSAGDAFATTLIGVDDLDGDGLADLAIGAPEDDPTGYASGRLVFVSSATGLTLAARDGPAPLARLGSALALLDDIDGDGLRDLAVGAPLHGPSSAGRIELVSSATGAALQVLPGTVAFGLFGSSLAGLDFNGDGMRDLAAGAPYGLGATAGSGFVDLLRAPGFGLAERLNGQAGGDLFGFAIASAGDGDGDGFDDLVIGALGADDGGFNSGRIDLISHMGARVYGVASGPLVLELLPIAAAPAPRMIRASGAAVGAIGSIAISFAPASFTALGLEILVNWDPMIFVQEGVFGFGIDGTATFPVNLRAPWLSGLSLYLQAYQRDFPLAASAGLELRFRP